jgi:hypothetical protein
MLCRFPATSECISRAPELISSVAFVQALSASDENRVVKQVVTPTTNPGASSPTKNNNSAKPVSSGASAPSYPASPIVLAVGSTSLPDTASRSAHWRAWLMENLDATKDPPKLKKKPESDELPPALMDAYNAKPPVSDLSAPAQQPVAAAAAGLRCAQISRCCTTVLVLFRASLLPSAQHLQTFLKYVLLFCLTGVTEAALHCRYQNPGNADSTISLMDPEPHGSHSVGLSSFHQNLNLGASSSVIDASGGTSALSENDSLKKWLRPPLSQSLKNWIPTVEHSSSDVSTPLTATLLDPSSVLIKEPDSSYFQSKPLSACEEETESMNGDDEAVHHAAGKEEKESMNSDKVVAAAAEDASVTATASPPPAGPMFASPPAHISSFASKLPKLQIRDVNACIEATTAPNSPADATQTGGDGCSRLPLSPGSVQGREVAQAACSPNSLLPKSPKGSKSRATGQSGSSLSASPLTPSSSAISILPSGDCSTSNCPPSSGVHPRITKLDGTEHWRTLPPSKIPTSPTRANASNLPTEASSSEAFHSCPLPKSHLHPTALPTSPRKSLTSNTRGPCLSEEVWPAQSTESTDPDASRGVLNALLPETSPESSPDDTCINGCWYYLMFAV